MIFRPFYKYETGCASYFVGCGGKGKAVVVDPVADYIEDYLRFAEQKHTAITHVIDTHVHADHLSAGAELARRGGGQYVLHRAAGVASATAVDEGDIIQAGNVELKVVHTPGHTPESLCLLVTDRVRGGEPWFVLTGDTLFVGSVGRPDLPGDALAQAGELFDSIYRKLLTLDPALEVYPGHFSGSPCGTGLSGKPMTTLAFEKRFNPFLSMDRSEFIAKLTATAPAKPAGMDAILARNRGATA